MAVIAFVGNKGGAGKTTLAINLANAVHQISPTVVLDADPQGSALQWRAMCESDNMPDVFDATTDLEILLTEHRSNYEHIIIDCPPQPHSSQTNEALAYSDVAIIPVLPSPLDLWATVHVEEAISHAQNANPSLRPLLVINQLEPRTRLSKLIRQAIDQLEMPAAETAIRRRAVYRSSVLEGKSVMQMGAVGNVAQIEIRELVEEVLAS